MNVVEFTQLAVDELKDNLGKINNDDAEKLAKMIFEAKKIYIAAAGRAKLVLSAFAMRLMHMGFEVYIVGEIVTPAFEAGDLLIVGSGSGKTMSVLGMAKKAKELGGKVAVLTIFPDSPIAGQADIVVHIGGRTSKVSSDVNTIQPGGNVFEQSMFIFLDCMIVRIAEIGNIDISRYKRHANLE